jgi:serine/threonine protein kinase
VSKSTDYKYDGKDTNTKFGQIKSSKSVTIHSDIYSLGVVLWQMVMGKKPYATESLSLFDIHSKIVTEKLVDTKTEFDPLINKATEKAFHDRFENCNEFRNALLLLNGTFKNASDERTSVSVDVTEVLIKSPKSENELEKPNESPSALKNKKSVRKAILSGSVILVVFLSLVAFNKFFRSDDSGISDNQAESKSKISGSILKIENATNSSLSVAVAFKNEDYQTTTTGWYSVEPDQITQVKIPNDVSEEDVFWFAKSVNGKEFGGNDISLCVESGSFTYDDQESMGCSSKKGFKRANHAYALIEE